MDNVVTRPKGVNEDLKKQKQMGVDIMNRMNEQTFFLNKMKELVVMTKLYLDYHQNKFNDIEKDFALKFGELFEEIFIEDKDIVKDT